MIKKFAIYCSEGASRIIKFYSFNKNLVEYKPEKVIYDGENKNVINKLTMLFGNDLVLLKKSELTKIELKQIHTTTSLFLHRVLVENNVEYLLCFGDKILKRELIKAYHNKLINFHPAILPSFKGLKAIDQALEFGSEFLGNTAHYIDEGIDTGKIIIQSAMLKEDFNDYEDVLELQFPLIKMILRDFINYDINDEKIIEEIINRKKPYLISKKCKK